MINTFMEASNSIFIDTWAWLALANRRDTYHKPVRENYLKLLEGGNRASPIPSEFPYLNAELDEVITALFMNVAFDSAVKFVESLFIMIKETQLELEKITDEVFKEAWILRKKYADKPDISFTDLTSFVIMQKKKIRKVFTANSHFKKVNLGFEILLP